MKADRSAGEKEGGVMLTLSGDAGLACAEELQEKLADALSEAKELVIDAIGVTDADVSTIQLLCAAHKTALKQRKLLVLRNVPEPINHAVKDAAFFRREGCMDEPEGKCLWRQDQ